MTTEKMTVHKALCELKILDDRITGAIASGQYCKSNKHSNQKIDGVTLEEFKKKMQGDYDKVTDLITRRNSIKRAVVLSNATTTVKVDGVNYTVAEAIEMKNHGIEFDRDLLSTLSYQYSKAKNEIEKNNGKSLEERVENHLVQMYGSKENRVNTDEIDKVKNAYIEAQSFDLIDPLKIVDKIENLEDKISKFKSEVDSALSVSNALTEIEVSY